MLNYEQLQVAVVAAKQQLSLILKKYPDLIPKKVDIPQVPYLVIALPGEQVWIDCTPKDILKDIPAMVINSSAKTRGLELLSRIKKMERQDKDESEVNQLTNEFEQLVTQLQYDGKYQVEIRFKYLAYEQIWELQVDDLVDRDLTPQGKANIRIVLGTLARFVPDQKAE